MEKDLNNKLEELIYQAEFDGEKRVNRLSLILCGITVFIVSINILFTKFYLNTLFNIIGFGSIGLYHCVLFFILKRGKYKSYIKYISATIHITAITIVIFGYSFY